MMIPLRIVLYLLGFDLFKVKSNISAFTIFVK